MHDHFCLTSIIWYSIHSEFLELERVYGVRIYLFFLVKLTSCGLLDAAFFDSFHA